LLVRMDIIEGGLEGSGGLGVGPFREKKRPLYNGIDKSLLLVDWGGTGGGVNIGEIR